MNNMQAGGGMPNVEQMQQQQQQQAEMESQRESILDQILEPDAKARIARMMIVKKEKARAIQDQLIKAATTGQLKSKVTEAALIQMIESGGDEDGKMKKTVIQRRNYGMDSDDDDDNDDDLM